MSTFTELLPPTKSEPKGAAIDWTPNAEGKKTGTLVIKQKRGYASYGVAEFDVEWKGRGFVLVKLTKGSDPTEDKYSCFFGADGLTRFCDCKGFTYVNCCKHVSALATLIEQQQL